MLEIKISVKSVPGDLGFNDYMILFHKGRALFYSECSTAPDDPACPQIDDGQYSFQYVRFGGVIVLNDNAFVRTRRPNPAQKNQYLMQGCTIHAARKNPPYGERGSMGCITIPVSKAERFFKIIDDLNISDGVIEICQNLEQPQSADFPGAMKTCKLCSMR